MHLDRRDQIGIVLFVEVVQIRDVLEVVRIQIALDQRGVRGDVVGELNDLERPARLREHVLGRVQDLRVRCGRCADRDGLVVRAARALRIVSAAAARQRGQAQRARQQGRNFLLHRCFLSFFGVLYHF